MQVRYSCSRARKEEIEEKEIVAQAEEEAWTIEEVLFLEQFCSYLAGGSCRCRCCVTNRSDRSRLGKDDVIIRHGERRSM